MSNKKIDFDIERKEKREEEEGRGREKRKREEEHTHLFLWVALFLLFVIVLSSLQVSDAEDDFVEESDDIEFSSCNTGCWNMMVVEYPFVLIDSEEFTLEIYKLLIDCYNLCEEEFF